VGVARSSVRTPQGLWSVRTPQLLASRIRTAPEVREWI